MTFEQKASCGIFVKPRLLPLRFGASAPAARLWSGRYVARAALC
jgi:hypothetical protein